MSTNVPTAGRHCRDSAHQPKAHPQGSRGNSPFHPCTQRAGKCPQAPPTPEIFARGWSRWGAGRTAGRVRLGAGRHGGQTAALWEALGVRLRTATCEGNRGAVACGSWSPGTDVCIFWARCLRTVGREHMKRLCQMLLVTRPPHPTPWTSRGAWADFHPRPAGIFAQGLSPPTKILIIHSHSRQEVWEINTLGSSPTSD